MAVCRVEKNRNYTVMANHHLKDTLLSLKSVGLLSKVLSLPDDWDYTIRGLASICKEGAGSIGAALRELESAGYLERRQIRNGRGMIIDTEYVFYEQPKSKADDVPSSEPEPHTVSPHTGFPYMDNPGTDNPDMGNTAQSNTNQNKYCEEPNIDLSNINQSINASEIDKIDDYKIYREIVMDNIEYDRLIEAYGADAIDGIVGIMLSAICGSRKYIRIGGRDFPSDVVKSRLLKLNPSHIEYVLECMGNTTTRIKNIHAYMLTALYNAPDTMDAYYTALVNHDLYGTDTP